MPELPEVETLKRQLETKIKGEKIIKVELFADILRFPLDKAAILAIKDFKITELNRRGKYLLLSLEKEGIKKIFLIHLGMSGTLRIIKEYKPKAHDHLIISFAEQKMVFNDPRKFGALMVYEPENPPNYITNLGIEPLTETFDWQYLKNLVANKRKKIKTLIMEQHMVVGVGNIYASEALFLANISPFREAKTLNDEEIKKLVSTIKQVLQKGIENQGTTLKDYKQSDGSKGHNQDSLLVYGRDNQPCFNCQTLIKNEIITGRMSYFCPNCQK